MKRKKIYIIAFLFGLLVVILTILVLFSPFLLAKNSMIDFQNQSITDDGKKGWESAIERGPVEFVLTSYDLLNPTYSTIEGTYEYSSKFSNVYVYKYHRDNIFDLSWDIKKTSSNTVDKPFDQVVELAKKTDIGMINRKIINYDNGDNCKPVEGQLGMFNCRKSETDEGYDPDISTYVPKTKEQEEISRKQDEEIDRIIKESELTRPTPTVYEPGDVRLNKEVKDMGAKISEEGSNTRMTPERLEEIYIEFKKLVNSFPPEKSKNIDEALKELQSVFQLDENGKYVGEELMPTPVEN